MASRRKELSTAQSRFADLPVVELQDGMRVYEARTWATRRDGLSGLPDLPADWGLHIAPCRSIHMVGMRFPLDLVWIGRDGDVVRVDEGVRPRAMKTCLRSRSVIEVNAGEGDRFAAAWGARAQASGVNPSDSELMQ